MKRAVSSGLLVTMLLLFFPIPAFADSSWVWLATTPENILPYAIIGTLAIEIFIIAKFNHIKRFLKVSGVVTLANALSFGIPYLLMLLLDDPKMPTEWSGYYNFYIIGAILFFITIAIELPTVYQLLKNDVSDRKRLIITTVVANTITTVLVVLCARLICVGIYAS
jgi:hypothetical protein